MRTSDEEPVTGTRMRDDSVSTENEEGLLSPVKSKARYSASEKTPD